MSEWQPAIAIKAHDIPLCQAHASLFGSRILIREDEMGPHETWAERFGCQRAFLVCGHREVWLCEHEILTD